MRFIFAALFLVLDTGIAIATPILCGLPDDTPTANAAIAATGILELPIGKCNIGSINATNQYGILIRGFGIKSVINPIRNGVAVIDLTGSSHPLLQDFYISSGCERVLPTIGILTAQPAAGSAAGSNVSDAVRIQNVRVDGCFNLAAHFNLSVASSSVSFSQFYNYSGITVVHTGNNFWGAASIYTHIDNANDLWPSDWTYTSVEIHNMASLTALWLGGAQSYRFYGGNISSSAPPIDLNSVAISGVGTVGPQNLIIDGTTLYNDNPPTPACMVKNHWSAAAVPAFRMNSITSTLMCP